MQIKMRFFLNFLIFYVILISKTSFKHITNRFQHKKRLYNTKNGST